MIVAGDRVTYTGTSALIPRRCVCEVAAVETDDGSRFICLRLPDGREVWVDEEEVER